MKIIPPIGGYYGGKSLTRAAISSFLPPHRHFISPFSGFASVELFKPQAECEILGDAHPGTIAALLAIRDTPDELISKLSELNWGEPLFESAQRFRNYALAEYGWAEIAYSAMAYQRGGTGRSGYSQQQTDRAARRNWGYLKLVSERLQNVYLRCAPWQETVSIVTSKTVLYVDPPYLKGGEHYSVLFTEDDHIELLEWCNNSNAKIVLSGYHSALYDKLLKGWQCSELQARNNQRDDRVEVIWRNF